MKQKIKILSLSCVFVASLLALASCEKMIVQADENYETTETEGEKVTFRITKFENTPFDDPASLTRADVSSLCTRLQIGVYQNGAKVQTLSQTFDDENFGEICVNLTKGDYQVVAIAHSGEKAANMTRPDSIIFNGKVTDTFYITDSISVTSSTTFSLELKRPVSKFQLVASDEIPKNATRMKFYYQGGSSNFNAITGYGATNSRQTEYRSIEDVSAKPSTYDIYTFLKDETDELTITVSTLDSLDNTIHERKFEDVFMRRNTITRYVGDFFGYSDYFSISINDTWNSTINYDYGSSSDYDDDDEDDD